MKKWYALILTVLIACMLSACSEGTADPTDAGSSSPAPVESTDAGASIFAPTAPAEPCNDLIEYDPDRELYFTCHNYDYDIYWDSDSTPHISFFILSKEPLDIYTLEIQIDINSKYEILFADYEGDVALSGSNPFPDYLYQRYMGVDWTEEIDYSSYVLFEGTKNETTVKAAYNTLTPEDLPQFYSYIIEVHFSEVQEEAFSEILVCLEGKYYRINFGEIRLHPELPVKYTHASFGLNQMLGFGGYYFVNLYTDGLGYMQNLFNFTAQEDLDLLELEWLSPGIEVLDYELSISSPGSDASMNLYWDGKTPIFVSKGSTVNINVYYKDPRQDENLDYIGKIWAILNIEQNGERYSGYASVMLRRALNRAELYAIVFDGLDMEPYYRNRVNKIETWRENYS